MNALYDDIQACAAVPPPPVRISGWFLLAVIALPALVHEVLREDDRA